MWEYWKGRKRIEHVEWDDMWLHRSKRDLLESRGLRWWSTEFSKLDDVMEVQFYGKRLFLDFKVFKDEATKAGYLS